MPALETATTTDAFPPEVRASLNRIYRAKIDPSSRRSMINAPAFVARVRALSKTHSDAEIARKLNCGRTTVRDTRSRHGIAPFQQSRRFGKSVVPPPSWCPPDLIEGFHRYVYQYGQFMAAAWVRRQLRRRSA